MDKTYIIRSRTLIPISSEPVPDGACVIRDGVIADIGNGVGIARKYPSLEVLDLGDRIVMPSLVNAHTHITLSDACEVNTGAQFPQWLFDLVKYRTPLGLDDFKSVNNGFRELLANGITTIGDSDPTLVPLEEAIKSDFRGVFYFEVFGLSAPIQFFKILQYKIKLSNGQRIKTDRCRLGISPHTPYTATPLVLRFASNYASRFNMQTSMHVAECEGEIEFLKSKKGIYPETLAKAQMRIPTTNLSPMFYVNSFNLLSDRFVCAHGVHLTDDEFQLLAKNKSSLVSCPSSNHNVGAGHLDITKPLKYGVNLCIGTDSPASGDGYDLFHELRLALKIGDKDEVQIPARKALSFITTNAAKALGFENEIAPIEIGKSADLIALDPPDGFNDKNDDPENAVVRSSVGKDVALTISSGKIRYSRIDEIRPENTTE